MKRAVKCESRKKLLQTMKFVSVTSFKAISCDIFFILITLPDLLRLDSACCTKKSKLREIYLSCFRTKLAAKQLALHHCLGYKCLKWLVSRNVEVISCEFGELDFESIIENDPNNSRSSKFVQNEDNQSFLLGLLVSNSCFFECTNSFRREHSVPIILWKLD